MTGHEFLRRLKATDWRIFLGVTITALWIALGVLYLYVQPGNVLMRGIDELGGFLEGAFAPLAFMWLVIGLFIQQKELADNTEVMRQSMLQAEQQAQAMAAMELNARQEAFFTIAGNVKRQLATITGMQFISAFGSTEGNLVPEERIFELWTMVSHGDSEAFAREILMMGPDAHGGRQHIFYGTELRRRHSLNYRQTFERLVALAARCDMDGMIGGTVTQTGLGLYYNLLVQSAPAEATVLVDTSNVAPILQPRRQGIS
ncbi:MAG: hypothetical protein H6994_14425 [Pseudomonadales bacterium]|nr:hypothetical protein [Pseudomonadales bacterium]